MSDSVAQGIRRFFGWLSAVLFSVFIASVVLGKFNVMTNAHLTLLPDVANFLLLFFAAGSLVAYAAWPGGSAAVDSTDDVIPTVSDD